MFLEEDDGFLKDQLDLELGVCNTDVTGEGDLTKFEKYSIAVMIAKRDFAQ